MKKKLVMLLVTVFVLAGCQSKTEEDSDKLQIVATYSIVADMVENIVQDKADVYSMVPIGTDPHMYDPLPADVEKVSKADMIFYNGLNLETGKGWFNDLLTVTNKSDVAYVVSEEVDPMYLTGEGQETEQDPHAWLDIQNAIKYVDVITKKVIEADPDNREFYLENQTSYVKELNELDTYAKEEISKIPEAQRILVTSEGAFKYFSKAYGFQAAYIWEINTDSQGTPEQMERILKIIQDNDVKALFVETSINPKTMETVSNETGVPIYSKIFTDSLAKEGEEGDTYISMMKWNIDHVISGLSQE